ncbi:PREDICTED: uncharacterized protein LOC104813354 [Tarenaya hassleriana]|uniref:uncharacterized protein LOC104813354 n=1 Tax=Tarenaya hassleriana TaxID=28532 RepID=UPI00053CA010|nr:PREDICTED: uncharacterized protein LOC104813354 [Tarenaya hassleriana]
MSESLHCRAGHSTSLFKCQLHGFFPFATVFSPLIRVLCPQKIAGEMMSFGEETHEDWHEFEVMNRDDGPKILVKKTSMETERQISVDPKSLKPSSMRNNSFNSVLPPAISPPRSLDLPLPLPLQPVKTRFVSCSLPNSATTSPKSDSNAMKKNKNEEQYLNLMLVQDAAAAFRRSKSCGEGLACAPSLDFDVLMQKSRHGHHHHQTRSFSSKTLSHKSSISSFFSKTESNKSSLKSISSFKDEFKCNALCLYIPGFGKGKPVRSSRKDGSFVGSTTATTARTASIKERNTVISARASMEKFECGSWSSSALIYEDAADAGGPGEPVSAAFVFDKEPMEKEIKGVLKTSGSKSRRSTESSPRHVRFSTSSPVSYPASPTSSVTPRLLQATEDFNAFLEAQTV